MIDETDYVPPPRATNTSTAMVVIVIIAMLLMFAAGGGWLFFRYSVAERARLEADQIQAEIRALEAARRAAQQQTDKLPVATPQQP